jgi:dTDP-4-amino-4,6-dideoxygalactose transaminase
MKHADEIIKIYNRNGQLYEKYLGDIPGLKNIKRESDCYPIFWAYTVIVEDRDGLIRKLKAHNIDAMQIHPRNDIWSMFKDSKRELPGVDYFDKRELSLPSGWWVSEEDVFEISEIVKKGW